MKTAEQSMHFQTALVQLPLMVHEESRQKVTTPAAAAAVVPNNLAQEAFFVLTLNTKNGLINKHLVTLGLLDASLVHPREVFRPAVLDGAAAIIVAHNHPSGDLTPSAEDLRVTRQLVEAGQILDIPVLDHVIVGAGPRPYLSMREEGLSTFGK